MSSRILNANGTSAWSERLAYVGASWADVGPAVQTDGRGPAGTQTVGSRRVAGITSPAGRSVERTDARGRTARPHGHRRPAKVAQNGQSPSVQDDSISPFAADLRSIPTAARPRASGAARCPLG
jgi:hypothetical protein